ncbi:MAG TPA: methionine--tRNA ligase subunit beta [Candidatus Paceibacterota bacterium]|nr:methionine--tRNA ligase subunit beta [Candidatus Paceibacterota bacterium]
MGKEKFEDLISEALKKLPYRFLNKLKNVAIIVQNKPSEFQKQQLGYSSGGCILGLYEGVPQIKRQNYNIAAPDKITLFQKNIENAAGGDEEKIQEIVQGTVWHEIAHHFGMNEEEIQKRVENKKPFSGKETITFDQFQQLDLRSAKILKAEKIEGADKLLLLDIDLGEEKRQLVAGIAQDYSPDELVGKTIIIIANLEPREIKGYVSQGMLLAVDSHEGAVLLVPEGEVSPGSKVK